MKHSVAWARMRCESVVHRRDVDFRLQHPEAPLDVGQGLVAADHLLRCQVRYVGDQQQLAVHQLGLRHGGLVHRAREEFALQIHLDDLGQVHRAHRVIQACLGAAVR